MSAGWSLAGLVAIGAALYVFLKPGQAQAETVNPLPINSGGNNLSLDIQAKSGKRYSAADIAGFAGGAGFAGDDLITAVAIALAESGGKSTAYNPETAAHTPDGLGSYGLWQIYLKAHPEFTGQDLTDPQTNADAAFSIYQAAGASFRPWSTFKNNAYQAHLQDAQDAVNA